MGAIALRFLLLFDLRPSLLGWSRGHSYFGGGHRFEVPFAFWLEAIATRVEGGGHRSSVPFAIWLEAIATWVEAIPISVEAIALRFLLLFGWRPLLLGWRVEAIALRFLLLFVWRPSLLEWRPFLFRWRPSLFGSFCYLVGGHCY